MPLDGGRIAKSDLNYLLFRQQIERSRATSAASAAARNAHRDLAERYEQRIERLTGGGIRFAPLRAGG